MKNLNIGYQCTQEKIEAGLGQQTAIRWVYRTNQVVNFTYDDLNGRSNQAANALIQAGVQAGDKLLILMPKLPELFYYFLGCLKMNANSSILFQSIGDDTICERAAESGAQYVITVKDLLFKLDVLRKEFAGAIKLLVIDSLEYTADQIGLAELYSKASTRFEIPATTGETLSHFHFTSGSTGRPKAVQHVHGMAKGVLGSFKEVFQPSRSELYWCTADQGWVTGVSYGIIAPLASGITQIQTETAFNPFNWMKLLETQKIEVVYTAPTVFRMLMQQGDGFYSQFDLSNLKRLYCVGEPLNPAIIEWGHRVFGKEIHDTWFQTETGSIMIANRPGITIRPGSMGKPLSHIDAQILDKMGGEVQEGRDGLLCFHAPWDSIFRAYIGHPQIYQNKFLDEYYCSGDIVHRDAQGYYWYVGRNDDVINTAGHLVSPFEVESALLEIHGIIDVGVISAPDDLLFEKVVAYVVIGAGIEFSKKFELNAKLYVSKKVSSIASPKEIVVIDKIPKTKSGKIMRRVLKSKYLGQELGDLSTLEENYGN